MKLRTLLFLALFPFLSTYVQAQEPFFLVGQVTATETGYPVSQIEVSVGLIAGQALLNDFTDADGSYSIEIPPAVFDTTTTLFVWVYDCNQAIQLHTFIAGSGITYVIDFSICTQNTACQANFIYRTDSTDQLAVSFENLSFPVTNTTNWLWDFGDGSSSLEYNPIHIYPVAGIYHACLTMMDTSANCTGVFCQEVYVGNNPGDCQAQFTWFSQGLSVSFTDLSVGDPDTWIWDFGDGSSSGEPNPVHGWAQSGTYPVSLTIINTISFCESTFTAMVTVGDSLPDCQAGFTYSSFHTPIYEFTNMSTGQPDQVVWDFGDGTTSNEYNPIHVWPFPGVYSVCLSIYNSITQCESTYCEDIIFGDTLPSCHAAYTYEQTGDLTFAFTNNSTGMIDQVIWDFGDGSPYSNDFNTEHTWQQPGVYQVCLTILNDSSQCQDTYCDYIYLSDTLTECHAEYSYQDVGNNTLAFTNLSSGFIDQFIWDFGDGTTSAEFEPVHTWMQSGIYQVCLSVYSNNTTCQDVFCMEIIFGDTISACQASFSFRVDSIPGNINHYWFTDESQGTNITSWYWDFGDGNYSNERNPEHTFIDSGNYNVCLTISNGEGPVVVCTSTACKPITTPAYYNLGGQIFAGNFPINNPNFTGDTATVRLFRKTGNHLSEVASGFFYQIGYYYFLNVMEGDYVVQAGLTPQSNAYQSYLPAYTGETQHWQQSQEISLATGDVFNADVIMPELTQINTGPGMINGSIFSIDNSVVDFRNRIIFLSQSGSIVKYTRTGENGDFSFRDLPLGSYRIMAEIAGIYSQSIDINLTENVVQASDIQIQVSVSPILGLTENPLDGFSKIRLYPNPANEIINLEFLLNDPFSLIAEVYTSSGVNCSKSQYSCISGENILSFNISALKPGIYLILLKSADGKIVNTVKFAKS